ncbi:thiamine pyrophosphate-dependent dehydrogenase E1 component subunit alpha, partial [Staphylococcus aureus]|nr:thiamine pyrophosphate-dependent dehydrogenase E1 component subunit alpha [Staphylococcus aureus]
KKELLSAGIIDDAWLAEIEAEHKDIINKATKAAEDAPYPSVEEAYAFVYEEGSLN